MFIIKTVDGLVVEKHNILPLDYVEYVKQSLSVAEITQDCDCVGKIHTDSGLLLEAPTLFHSASKQSWIITDENYMLLVSAVNMTTTKIMTKFTTIFQESKWFEEVNLISLTKNKIKAYIKLKELLKSAPTYIEIYDL